MVGSRDDVNLMKSIRNLKSAKFLMAEAINVYDILNYDHLVISDSVVTGISERLKTAASRKDEKVQEVKKNA